MTERGYLVKINKAMRAADTYQEIYTEVIKTLAAVLAERDHIYEQYVKEGSEPLVDVLTDRGSPQRRPNPLLDQWNKLNQTALSYWKELGLTPAGLKKLNDEATKEPKMSPLDSVLAKLEK